MRFLLTQTANKARPIKRSPRLAPQQAKPEDVTSRAWGQQCSPNCGCVLRFDVELDQNERVQSSTYHAKSVVTSVEKGKTRPQWTWKGSSNENRARRSDILLTECKCDTLHTLAQSVSDYLLHKTLSTHVRNQLEFSTSRSPSSFQHAVLRQHGLSPERHSGCFDLVEDALVAMARGYVPKPRKAPLYQQGLKEHYQPLSQKYDREFLLRYRKALQRISCRTTYSSRLPFQSDYQDDVDDDSPSSSSWWSFFWNQEDHRADEASKLAQTIASETVGKPSDKEMDWLSYVDELGESDEDRQESA